MIKVNDRQCCKAISSKLRELSLNSSTIEQSRQWVRFGKPFKQIGFDACAISLPLHGHEAISYAERGEEGFE